MSLRAQVTGPIANPVLRWTGQQRPVLEVRLNATASIRDKNTGEWGDIGDPLWVSATFWDREAEHLAELLGQGDRVTVEGTLVIESFQRRDGAAGVSHSLRLPRFLGVIPRNRESSPSEEFSTGPIRSDAAAPF